MTERRRGDADPDRAMGAHDLRFESLLSAEGWAYASLPPVEAGDPGRFHALFGRDSLIFALQVLPARPRIARATLRKLAALQGRVDDPEIDEEPGKIVHEYRPVAPPWLVAAGWPVRDGGIRYYGTADATSWFLVLLAACGDRAFAAELAGAWRAAAGWLERVLDRGDGLVRHGPRTHPGGLSQQGWRDGPDPSGHAHGQGIVRPDGTAPRPPLADADSQAAAVAALRALAVLDPDRAAHWRERATALRARVGAAFTPEVMALEAGDVAVPGAGSQLGWLLWAGALDGPAARAAAARLLEPDVCTAFGLRTLSAGHPAFFPHGYHRGAVWPFDSWLGWGGLRAHGHPDAAERVRTGVLAALQRLGRAPELYAVTAPGELEPVAIANRVQAWTVGAAWALGAQWDGRVAE
jgi:glycogen debranching enzyme